MGGWMENGRVIGKIKAVIKKEKIRQDYRHIID